MPSNHIISCHGWSVDVGKLLESGASDESGMGLEHVIASLSEQSVGARENPYRASVESELRRRCRALGIPGVDRCFSPSGVGRLAALCFPSASRESLRLCTMAMVLALMLDDVLERRGGDRDQVQGLAGALKAAIGGQVSSRGTHPLIDLAGEIHQAVGAASPSNLWFERFRSSFDSFVDMAVNAYNRWLAGQGATSLMDYVHERYHDIGVGPMLALVELATDHELDRDVSRHPDMVALRSACIFYMAFVNDVFSYHKEVIAAGNMTNAIAVVQMQFRLSFARAAALVVALARQCLQEFCTRARRLLDDSGLSDGSKSYVHGVSAWMAGALQWTCESERYRHPESPFPELRTPASKREHRDLCRSPGTHRDLLSPSATVTKRRTASI